MAFSEEYLARRVLCYVSWHMSHADDQRGFYNMASIDIECCSSDVHCCIINAAYYFIGFPRVLGCIDCTHIPISACLGENEGDYVNRKSFHSLNIQATCDHRCLSRALRQSGLVQSMTRIFSESSLCHKLEQGMATVHSYCFVLKLPFVVLIMEMFPLASGLFSGVLLGD
ncbi:hypothetical protein F7725_005801, partial [Dissostichus mawsoni]